MPLEGRRKGIPVRVDLRKTRILAILSLETEIQGEGGLLGRCRCLRRDVRELRRWRVEKCESGEVGEEMREAGEWGKMIIFGVWKGRFCMMR